MDTGKINSYVKGVTKNNLFQSALIFLGVVFTVSTIINNYHFIKFNKIRIKNEQDKLKS